MKFISPLCCLVLIVLLWSCGSESGTNQQTAPDAAPTPTTEKTVDLSQNGRLPLAEFVKLLEAIPDAQLIDVRTPNECKQGVLPNSVNINYHDDGFDEELGKLDRAKPIFVYCQAGGRSGKTYFKLKKMGFEQVYEMRDGYLSWKQQFGSKEN